MPIEEQIDFRTKEIIKTRVDERVILSNFPKLKAKLSIFEALALPS